ncbi:Protein of unknown function, partial [Gryllus bimaculatus]
QRAFYGRSGYAKKLDNHRNTSSLNKVGGGGGGGSGGGGGGAGGGLRGWGPASAVASKPRFPADRQFVLGVSLTSGGANTKGSTPPTTASPATAPALPPTPPTPPPPPPPLSFEVVDQPEDEDEDDAGDTDGKGSSSGGDDSDASGGSTEAPSLSKLQPRLAAGGSRRATWQRIASSNDAASSQQTPAFVLRRRGPLRPVADFFSREHRQ